MAAKEKGKYTLRARASEEEYELIAEDFDSDIDTETDDDEPLARLLPTFVDDTEFNNDAEDGPVPDADVNNDQ